MAKTTISAKVDIRTIAPLEREAKREGLTLSAHIANILWMRAELIRDREREAKLTPQ